MVGWERPGPWPLTEKREWFARLIAQGVNNSEACRIVGVNRKTGKRWRHGRTVIALDGSTRHYVPVVQTRPEKRISTRYLSEDERVVIGDLRRAKLGVREIARELGRDPSTISRELCRNRDVRGQYRPFAAHRMAVERRARPGRGKVVNDAALRAVVVRLLGQRKSPEQVAHELPDEFPGEPARQLVTETVYQARCTAPSWADWPGSGRGYYAAAATAGVPGRIPRPGGAAY